MDIQNQSLFEIISLTLSAVFMLFFGHNLWLVSKDEESEMKIEAITSDTFPESDSAVKTERIASFRVYDEDYSADITNFEIEGNVLEGKIKRTRKAAVAALELYPHPISLEAEKFAGYIKSEDAGEFVAPHFVSGETTSAQRESYAKFAKVLMTNEAENFEIFTQKVGHRFEIVPVEVPNGKKLRVQVLFDGKQVENLRVSAGAANINGGKYLFHTRTDEQGYAEIEFTENDLCYVRAHMIRPHSDAENYEWESFWASLTFRV